MGRTCCVDPTPNLCVLRREHRGKRNTEATENREQSDWSCCPQTWLVGNRTDKRKQITVRAHLPDRTRSCQSGCASPGPGTHRLSDQPSDHDRPWPCRPYQHLQCVGCQARDETASAVDHAAKSSTKSPLLSDFTKKELKDQFM